MKFVENSEFFPLFNFFNHKIIVAELKLIGCETGTN